MKKILINNTTARIYPIIFCLFETGCFCSYRILKRKNGKHKLADKITSKFIEILSIKNNANAHIIIITTPKIWYPDLINL